jgi:hypothetical protein
MQPQIANVFPDMSKLENLEQRASPAGIRRAPGWCW